MNYRFIEMTDEHLDQYEELLKPVMNAKDFVSKKTIPRYRKEKDFRAWILLDDDRRPGTWAGWCAAAENSPYWKDAIYLYGGAILPPYRGQGLSRLLYEHRSKIYTNRDLTLSVQPSNIKSLNIALNQGFRPVGFNAPWIGMLRKAETI